MPRFFAVFAATPVLLALAVLSSPPVMAQTSRSTTQVVADEIFGYALMTDRERDQYRERLRRLDDESRQRFEADHREQMRKRAKDRGIDLDDGGPGRGAGQGKGEPRGPGEGPGQRVGPYGEPPGQERKRDDNDWNPDRDERDKNDNNRPDPKDKGQPQEKRGQGSGKD